MVPVRMIPRRAHVCIVAPEFIGPFPNGGVGTACYWEAASLAAAGFDVTVLYTGPTDRETPDHWERLYQAFEYVDLMKWAHTSGEASAVGGVEHPCPEARTSELVYRFLRGRRFDLLLFQEFLGHGARTLQARRSGEALTDVPTVVTLHSCRQWIYQGMQRSSAARADVHVDFLERESTRLADFVNAPSQHMSDWAREHWRMDEFATVVPYCFDASTEGAPGLRTHAGPFEHLVFFGRLETRKGVHVLCRAIADHALARGPVRRITFLGKRSTVEGRPSEEFIRGTLADVDGIEIDIIDGLGSFEALEWIEQQERALVVAPSMVDNLPYAVIELFTRRIPFITTRIGGIPEIAGAANAHLLADPTPAGLAAVLGRVHADGALTVDYRSGYSSTGATAYHVDYVYSLLRWRPAERRLTSGTCDIVVTDAACLDDFRHRILTSDPTARDARFMCWDEWRQTDRSAPAIFASASVALRPGAVRRLLHTLQDARVDAATSYYVERPGSRPREVAPLGASREAGWMSNVFGGPCFVAAPSAFDVVRRAASRRFDFWPVYAAMACAGLDVALAPASLYSTTADGRTQAPEIVDAVLGVYASAGEAPLDLRWVLKAARHQASAASLYEWLVGVPDEALMALTGLAPRKPDPQRDELLHVRDGLRDLVAGWRHTTPRVFVYGAGEHARALLALEPELGRFVAGFIDRRAVSDVLGRPCVRPDAVTADMADVILYASREFERDMHAQVAHVPVQHILLYSPSPAPQTMSPHTASATSARLRRRLRHTSAPIEGLRSMYRPPAWATGYICDGDAEFLIELVAGVRPTSMLEVGVASGASSAALLFAMDQLPPVAGGRHLLSCDVRSTCYFDPARATGAAVAEMYPNHQTRWTLDTDTDARRLSQSVAPGSFDLLFIDANHAHPWPLLDLLHLVHVARPGAWVALHDIQLPVINPAYQVYGPMWLFDAWPFDKVHGVDGSRNIGAVRLPDDIRQLVPMALELLDRPWEHAPTSWHVALPEPFTDLSGVLHNRLAAPHSLAG